MSRFQKLNEKSGPSKAVSRPVMPTAEELLAQTKAPEWIQGTLFDVDDRPPAEPDVPEYLTAYVVALDFDLKPTIFLKSNDWSGVEIDIFRDANQHDVDVANLYLQKYKEQR